MNCKPGDLAVIVRDPDFLENLGAFLRVIRVAPDEYQYSTPTDDAPCDWECESVSRPVRVWTEDFQTTLAVNDMGFGDDQLRPIRDSDGEDETLTWAGKPEGVKA